jgi:hypothetical protein
MDFKDNILSLRSTNALNAVLTALLGEGRLPSTR